MLTITLTPLYMISTTKINLQLKLFTVVFIHDTYRCRLKTTAALPCLVLLPSTTALKVALPTFDAIKSASLRNTAYLRIEPTEDKTNPLCATANTTTVLVLRIVASSCD